MNYSKPYGASNVIGTLSASNSSRRLIGICNNNNHVGVHNLLTDFHRVVRHANSSGDSTHLLYHLSYALQGENYNQCFINFHPLQQLLVATDGEGDSNPEYTKLPVNFFNVRWRIRSSCWFYSICPEQNQRGKYTHYKAQTKKGTHRILPRQ